MSTPTRYLCYGLVVSSEVELPDLATAPDGAAVDVVVRYGDLDEPDPALVDDLGLWRDGDVCGLTLPDLGRFEARRGTEIVVDVPADSDPGTVRAYVMGSSMGATMMLRGTLVLHGNSFRIGDAAAVVLGRSGAGKSTLAAEFDRRGYDVLSDDVVPVDTAGNALPGYPRIKLWPDALDRLGRTSEGLERVHTGLDKYHLPLSRGALEPLPLRWIYVLERHAGTDLLVEPATGALTFSLLHEHTYRNEFLVGAEAAAVHLQQCARLLRGTRVSRVLRPAETMTAEATADAILADIATDQSKEPSDAESPVPTNGSSEESA